MTPLPRWLRHVAPVAAGALLLVGVLAWPGLRGEKADETTTPPATAPAGVPATTAPTDPAAECIAAWPRRAQVGQLVAIAVDGGTLTTEAERVAELGVGAVLLQRPDPNGLADGISELKRSSAIAPLVMVDEEGGEVQALSEVLGPLPSPARMAETFAPDQAAGFVAEHAAGVAALGIDMVLGPVVDVAPLAGGGPMGSRAFGSDPGLVADYARAYLEAYRAAGVTAVLKHFPGHGAASGDSHDGPVAVATSDELRARDLVPYESLLAEAGGVMVAHVVVPDLSGLGPGSLSAAVVDGLLRDDLGWDGLVITDSLSMGAVASSIPPTEAARLAIEAGSDLALFATLADPAAVLTRLELAVQRRALPQDRIVESVRRVMAAKGLDPCAVNPE